MTSHLRSARLRNALQIALVLCAVALICTPTSLSLIQNWNDFESMTQSHGWLIAACAFWIIYEAAASGPVVQLTPISHRAWVVVSVSLLWMLGIAASIQIVHHVLLPVLAFATVYALFGGAVARHYWFAFAYLYFAMAIWGMFSAPLQWATVYAMRIMVRAVGVPAFFHENFIELPSGLLVVEGGCSGLNFFVVALALSALYAYLNDVRRWWLLVALGAVLAMGANWARVLTIVIAGHLTDMQHYLVRVEHIRFGWAVFAVTMALFFVLANRMETKQRAGASNAEPTSSFNTAKAIGLSVVAAALLTGPVWYWQSQMRENTTLPPDLSAPSGWQLLAQSHDWNPVFNNADIRRQYRWQRDAQIVDGYQAVYSRQSQDGKLAGYGNDILGGALTLDMSNQFIASRPALSQSVVVDANNERWLLWHRYRAGDDVFATARRAQIVAGLRALVVPTAAAVETWRAPCKPDCVAAAGLLNEFVPLQQ